jgi:hypothetical protein
MTLARVCHASRPRQSAARVAGGAGAALSLDMKRVPPDNVVPLDRPITLTDLARAIEDLRALVEQMVVQPQPEKLRWVTVAEAARLACRSEAAIRKRCRERGIGVLVDGKWRVDRARLVT